MKTIGSALEVTAVSTVMQESSRTERESVSSEVYDPMTLFPGSSDRILGYLSMRQICASSFVSHCWREAWSLTLEDFARCGDEKLAVAGAWPTSSSEILHSADLRQDVTYHGLEELTRTLAWIPEICIIFGTGSTWLKLCRGQEPRVLLGIERFLPGNCIALSANGNGVIGPFGPRKCPRTSDDDFEGVSILLARSPPNTPKPSILAIPRGRAGNDLDSLSRNTRLGRALHPESQTFNTHHHTNPTDLAHAIVSRLPGERRKLRTECTTTHLAASSSTSSPKPGEIKASLVQVWLDHLNCSFIKEDHDLASHDESAISPKRADASHLIITQSLTDARIVAAEASRRGPCFGGVATNVIGGLVRHAGPCSTLVLTVFGCSNQVTTVEGTFDNALALALKETNEAVKTSCDVTLSNKPAWGLATMCCGIPRDDEGFDMNTHFNYPHEVLPKDDLLASSNRFKVIADAPIIGFLANGELTPDGRLVSYTTCLSLLSATQTSSNTSVSAAARDAGSQR